MQNELRKTYQTLWIALRDAVRINRQLEDAVRDFESAADRAQLADTQRKSRRRHRQTDEVTA